VTTRPKGYAAWRPQKKTMMVLEQVGEILEEYRDQLPLTARQIFYRLVGAHDYPKTEQAYERLCYYLNRARRARMIPFKVLRDDGAEGRGGSRATRGRRVVSGKEIAKRRGPKTPDGKLAVSRNASKHGILSPRPIASAFESEAAWKAHREAIIDSLTPLGGIEQVLADRVALASWRLNRVVVYETECIEQEQQSVIEEVREDRERTLRFASLHKREARKMVSGTMIEDPDQLSDMAIEAFSEPEAAFEAMKNTRLHYEAGLALYNADDEATISREGVYWLLDHAPRLALDYALTQRGEDDQDHDLDAFDAWVEELGESLEARLGDGEEQTVGEVRAHLDWLAKEAGGGEDLAVDGTVAYLPGEGLVEKLHTVALHALENTEERARDAERQIIEKRRARILPKADELQKIARYEAHLSWEMFRGLHELEAIQTRRAGGTAPLGRLDVSS
jgi:hypothetical protein